MAFEQFARGGVDIAVIETGLGGRLDATNCLRPILTLTTEISFDHVEILGRSLTKIAKEKAGIIKPSVPHLIGRLPKPALAVISDTCRKSGSTLHRLSPKHYQTDGDALGYSFCSNGWKLGNIRQSLAGEHQIRNGALALRAVSILRQNGYALPDKAVRRGLRKTNWPGRFQIIRKQGAPTIIVDVCHNLAGATAFAKTFKQVFPKRKCRVIIGLVKRKEHRKMLEALIPIADSFHVVRLSSRRTVDVTELHDMIARKGENVDTSACLSTAMKRVLQSSAHDEIIAVIGSHFLAGEYLRDFEWIKVDES